MNNILRFVSYLNNKHICTIYTHIKTCLMSIHRIPFRDKITLRQMKLYLYKADVEGWSMALDT